MDIPFVSRKIDEYIEINPKGNLHRDWGFTSNGHGFKLICDRINYGYSEMSWTAHLKLESQLNSVNIQCLIDNPLSNIDLDMNLLVPTLKIAAQYTAHKWMRRGWSKLWSSHVEQVPDGQIPPSVLQMKYHFRKGFNIMLHFLPEAVCI